MRAHSRDAARRVALVACARVGCERCMSATAGSGPGQHASVAVGENSKREAAACGRQIERSGYADELRIHGEGELRAEEEEKRIMVLKRGERGMGKDWY